MQELPIKRSFVLHAQSIIGQIIGQNYGAFPWMINFLLFFFAIKQIDMNLILLI